jgi:hypothetical protein
MMRCGRGEPQEYNMRFPVSDLIEYLVAARLNAAIHRRLAGPPEGLRDDTGPCLVSAAPLASNVSPTCTPLEGSPAA